MSGSGKRGRCSSWTNHDLVPDVPAGLWHSIGGKFSSPAYPDFKLSRLLNMSGLEVAGVVLGSLPVLAEAIDSWKAGRSQIGLWRNYGQSLNRLIGELQTQNVLFRDCMVSLLESAGVGGREIAAFKENDQVCMSNAEVNEDLRFLLGDAHDAFLHNVETFRRSLNEIADKLQQPVSVLNVRQN